MGRRSSMQNKETEKKPTEADIESDDGIEEDDTLLLDAEDAIDDADEAVVEEKASFSPGEVSDGQMDATRLYLSEIGFSSLLTAEEEVFYSRKALKGDMAASRPPNR